MSNSFHSLWRRSDRGMTRLIILGLLSVLVVSAAAQEVRRGEQSAARIVEDFERAWDDEAWGPEQGRGGKYMRPMNDPGWKHRMKALQMIARRGPRAAAELEFSLEDSPAPVRALITQALGYCGNPDVRPVLARVVQHDDDAMVRLYAADSLGMLGTGDYRELLQRIQPDEMNRDTKRHIGYAVERGSHELEGEVSHQLRQWNNEKIGAAKLNEEAPDFELTSLDGQQVRLSQFRGDKSVVLVFVYGDT